MLPGQKKSSAANKMTAASINFSVQNEDGIAEASPPIRPDIRRSLSPILDFGARRNFCNIAECHYCKPLAENHRLSPLRSPIMSPSSRFSHFCIKLSVNIHILYPAAIAVEYLTSLDVRSTTFELIARLQ